MHPIVNLWTMDKGTRQDDQIFAFLNEYIHRIDKDEQDRRRGSLGAVIDGNKTKKKSTKHYL